MAFSTRTQVSDLNTPERSAIRTALGALSILFIIATLLTAGGLFLYLKYTPLPPNNIANMSTVVADDGSTVGTLSTIGGYHNKVSLQDISPNLKNATLAVEDAHFYQHGVFNPAAILRAIWVDLRSGQNTEGASTITQQLAKNLFLTQDRTWSRKFKEAIYALQLQMYYSKDEILQQYLNAINYGQGAYGAESASELYFGKSSKELDLAEASMLAGIPRGPSLFSPFVDLQAARGQQTIVLNAMVRAGFITADQRDQALAETLHYAQQKNQDTSGQAPYFSSYVKSSATTQFGFSEDELARGGLTVQTTISPVMQKAAESAVQHYMPKNSDLQVALVAMDPQTGDIKAMVGGKNWAESSYNRVLAARQPGSSFKPFVYLTALENGFTPSVLIKSEPVTVQYGADHSKTYDVHNYNDDYTHTFIDMRTAISRSDNVYAVATNMQVGPGNVVETAKRMGITSDMQPYPSLALGTFPTTPLEMANAFCVLASGGYRVTPRAIISIQNIYGQSVLDNPVQKVQVEPAAPVFILDDLMRGVFEPGGTAARVTSIFNGPASGKTGTTDTDAWMIGFTSNLVCAVWVGYDKDRLVNVDESHAAAPIWAQFMKDALAGTNQTPTLASQPDGVVKAAIDPQTGLLATSHTAAPHDEYYLTGTQPRENSPDNPAAQSDAGNAGTKGLGITNLWDWMFKSHGKKDNNSP
ncbi:MAG: hypothetical protein JWN30_893 [Bacilli bacterium]|nr:hypothetical protein [Bacilli bacterium]